MREGGRFGGGGSLIQKGGVGDFQPGQFDDHGLKIQQSLEPSLGNFWLVGSVGGVPTRIFHKVAAKNVGSNGSVVAEADERAGGLV